MRGGVCRCEYVRTCGRVRGGEGRGGGVGACSMWYAGVGMWGARARAGMLAPGTGCRARMYVCRGAYIGRHGFRVSVGLVIGRVSDGKWQSELCASGNNGA